MVKMISEAISIVLCEESPKSIIIRPSTSHSEKNQSPNLAASQELIRTTNFSDKKHKTKIIDF